MNSNSLALVLIMSGIVNVARRVVANQVQVTLLNQGYRFAEGSDLTTLPQNLEAAAIVVSAPDEAGVRTISTVMAANPLPVDGPSLVFDANTQAQAFLDAAYRERPIVREMYGVRVTITRQSVNLNPTALLDRIMQEAKAVQRTTFGQS